MDLAMAMAMTLLDCLHHTHGLSVCYDNGYIGDMMVDHGWSSFRAIKALYADAPT
jgi:hypothetical protein